MYLWPGVEVIGCTRKNDGGVLNGCIYIVKDVDDKDVTLRLHEDYQEATKFDKPYIREALAPFVPQVEELLRDAPLTPSRLNTLVMDPKYRALKVELKKQIFGTSVTTRWHAFAHIFNTKFELFGQSLQLRDTDDDDEEEEVDPDAPDIVKLNHIDTCASFRLVHGLCYYSAQGTTIRDRHVVLFDTRNRYFSLRHLNVGLSRATHGCYAHVLDNYQENKLKPRPLAF